jgi:hypothetical protein
MGCCESSKHEEKEYKKEINHEKKEKGEKKIEHNENSSLNCQSNTFPILINLFRTRRHVWNMPRIN